MLAADMLLYTDTLGSDGCGAYYQGAWFFYAWRPHQHLQSIQWKELFAIVTATLTWRHQWQGKRVKFMCDNQAIVLAWQGQCSRDSHIMKLMHTLFMFAAHHHFTNTMHNIQYQHASRCHLLQAIHQISSSCSTATAHTCWHARHPLTRHLQHLLHLFARSTRQSYHTGIKYFIHFCKTQHVRLLPATSCTAIYFATALVYAGNGPSNHTPIYTCLQLVHVIGRMDLQTPAKQSIAHTE